MKKVFRSVLALAVAIMMVCTSMAFVAAEDADKELKVTFDGGSEPVFGISTSSLTADQWIGANGSTTDKFTLSVKFKIDNLVEGSVAAGRPITLFTGMTTFKIIGGKLYLSPATIDYDQSTNIELGDFTYGEWHILEMTSRQHYHRNGLTVKLDGVTLGGGELMDAANPSAYYWTCQRAAIPQAPLATITHNGNADSHVSSLAANDNGYFFGVAAWTDAAAGRPDMATYRGFDLYIDSINLDINSTLAGVPADINEEFANLTVTDNAVSFGEGSTLSLSTGTAAMTFAVEDEYVAPPVDPDAPEEELNLPTPAASMDVTVGSYTATVSADANGFVSAIANGNKVDIYAFPKAGYAVSSYSVDGGEAVPVIGEVISVPVAANCAINVAFEYVETGDAPELVATTFSESDNELVIKMGGANPAFGFTATGLTADQWAGVNGSETDNFTLSYRFKIANHVAGSVAAPRPIVIANGMLMFRIIGDKIYLSKSSVPYDFSTDVELGDFTYDEWHTMTVKFTQYYSRSHMAVTYDGVTSAYDANATAGLTYSVNRPAIPQVPLTTFNHNGHADSIFNNMNAHDKGFFFAAAAYSQSTDSTSTVYRAFDFHLDNLNLEFNSAATGLPDDIHEEFNSATSELGVLSLNNDALALTYGNGVLVPSIEVDEVSYDRSGMIKVFPTADGGGVGSGWEPQMGLTSTEFTSEATVDKFTVEFGFKLDNHVAGANAIVNPINFANGTNTFQVVDGAAYLADSTGAVYQCTDRAYIAPCEEGVWHDVKLIIYKNGEKVMTDVVLDGVVYRNFEITYPGITAPTPQSTKVVNPNGYYAANGHNGGNGDFFSVTWYGKTVAGSYTKEDEIPVEYRNFDLYIDYVNVDDGTTAIYEDFAGVTGTPYGDSWAWRNDLVFGADSTIDFRSFRMFGVDAIEGNPVAISTGLATYADNALSVISKLVPGTVTEFGLIVSPTAITGALTKEDLTNYYITNDIGNSEIYVLPAYAYGSDGRFGVELNAGESNYFTAFGKLHAYVYAINDNSDVVAILPVVFE